MSDRPAAAADRYPDYNANPEPSDAGGMSPTAHDIAWRIRLGLNIGDTLEAYGARSETFWNNPRITFAFIRFVKMLGFDAVRLPVSWNQYAHVRTARIDPRWLNRVAQVVDWCIACDLFVVVNIHWDGGWIEDHVNRRAGPRVAARLKAVWHQIATALRPFDHRLVLAGMNEPKVHDVAQMPILALYHQTFVDAVRSTGGRNAHRCLVVPGPTTDIDKTVRWLDRLPADTVQDRLLLEVHYYTPWNFTGLAADEPWGQCFHYWGQRHHSPVEPERNATWGEEDIVSELFARMAAKARLLGVPVLLGEYSARDRLQGEDCAVVPRDVQRHLASRSHYVETVTRQSLENGMVPFYWDNGALLDRRFTTVRDSLLLQALRQGVAAGRSHHRGMPGGRLTY